MSTPITGRACICLESGQGQGYAGTNSLGFILGMRVARKRKLQRAKERER